MKIPDKVREGDKLSARWLNQIVDCLAELEKQQKNGSSTLAASSAAASLDYIPSTYADVKYRPYVPDEGAGECFAAHLFELRIKPSDGTESEENATMVLQVHRGVVTDYLGNVYPVPLEGTTEWVDLCDIKVGADAAASAYCVITQNETGEVINAELSAQEQAYIPWGAVDGENGILSVPLGEIKAERIDEDEDEVKISYTITQKHLGAIALQTVQVTGDEKRGEPAGSGSGEADSEDSAGSGSSDEDDASAAPISLFLNRDNNLFRFKPLRKGKGIRLADDKSVTISLVPANMEQSSSHDTGSASITGTLGGVYSIVTSSTSQAVTIDEGKIIIPLADSRTHAAGVVYDVSVSYVRADDFDNDKAGTSGNNYISGGILYLTIPVPHTPGGSGSGSPDEPEPGSGSGSGSGSICCAECASLRTRIAELEKKLAELEKREPCDCAAAVRSMIDEAINNALADVKLAIQHNGVLENNAVGQLVFNTGVSYLNRN